MAPKLQPSKASKGKPLEGKMSIMGYFGKAAPSPKDDAPVPVPWNVLPDIGGLVRSGGEQTSPGAGNGADILKPWHSTMSTEPAAAEREGGDVSTLQASLLAISGTGDKWDEDVQTPVRSRGKGKARAGNDGSGKAARTAPPSPGYDTGDIEAATRNSLSSMDGNLGGGGSSSAGAVDVTSKGEGSGAYGTMRPAIGSGARRNKTVSEPTLKPHQREVFDRVKASIASSSFSADQLVKLEEIADKTVESTDMSAGATLDDAVKTACSEYTLGLVLALDWMTEKEPTPAQLVTGGLEMFCPSKNYRGEVNYVTVYEVQDESAASSMVDKWRTEMNVGTRLCGSVQAKIDRHAWAHDKPLRLLISGEGLSQSAAKYTKGLLNPPTKERAAKPRQKNGRVANDGPFWTIPAGLVLADVVAVEAATRTVVAKTYVWRTGDVGEERRPSRELHEAILALGFHGGLVWHTGSVNLNQKVGGTFTQEQRRQSNLLQRRRLPMQDGGRGVHLRGAHPQIERHRRRSQQRQQYAMGNSKQRHGRASSPCRPTASRPEAHSDCIHTSAVGQCREVEVHEVQGRRERRGVEGRGRMPAVPPAQQQVQQLTSADAPGRGPPPPPAAQGKMEHRLPGA